MLFSSILRNSRGLVFYTKQTCLKTMSSSNYNPVDKIKDVDIDSNGKFKYVLAKVYKVGNANDGSAKHVVRGYKDCPYHGDVFDRLLQEINSSGEVVLAADCLGGGRIQRDEGKILVYGYSQGFGPADHTISVSVLQKEFPSYEITSSKEGY